MDAGRLDRRLAFESPYQIDNGAGTYTDGFLSQFDIAANVLPLRGGEAVLAARLTGTGPAIATVRTCQNTRRIAPDWRCVDLRSGVIYAVKEPPRHPVDK